MRLRWPFRWPWEPSGTATPAQQASSAERQAFEQDRAVLRRDLSQVKHVNEFLLARGLARGWLSPEVAEGIRTTQAYEDEESPLGPADVQSSPQPPT
jgi:hypothetical protein